MNRALVLVGHRVTALDRDRTALVDQGGAITRDQLDRYLTRNAGRFVGIEALLDGSAPDGSLLLTFDDGYRDMRDTVLPLLEQHGAPAVLFATTGFIDGSVPQMERVLSKLVEREAIEDLDGIVVPTRTPSQRWGVYERLRGRLKMVRPAERRDGLRDLLRRNALGSSDAPMFLSWDELVELSKHPLVSVHAHTVSHPALTACADADVEVELREAREALRQRLGQEIEGFAYPYGDFDARVARAVRRAGYGFAVTTEPRRVRPVFLRGRRRFRIPRYDLAHAVGAT